MKILYVFLLTLIYYNSNAQTHKEHGGLYSTVQAVGYNTENVTAGGAHVSFGFHQNDFGFGPGVGLILLGTENPYIPLYVNVIYAGGKRKFSPMANFHVGKGFYKGSGSFIGEDSYVKAGFYAHAVGGLAIRFKKSRIHLFGGVTLMSFNNQSEQAAFHESLFTGGIGFFTTN